MPKAATTAVRYSRRRRMRKMVDPITRRLFQDAGRNGPLVLMYHSVQRGVNTADWRWAISQNDFVAHLDLLQDFGWSTYLFRRLAEAAPLPERSVLITFDDGYADNIVAIDELKKRGQTASFFVVTRDIGQRSCWHEADIGQQHMLAPHEIQDMAKAGMEIGSHSRRHTLLTGLRRSELDEEVQSSRKELEQIIASEVTGFSYPYGRYDNAAIEAVQSAGYLAACCTQPGVHRPPEIFAVRRLAIHNSDKAARFARKLAFADNRCDWPFVGRYLGGRLVGRLGMGHRSPSNRE
jgi:peptidoglycan/xylan/chitin deacetylase (PgdA/CDA1 family)